MISNLDAKGGGSPVSLKDRITLVFAARLENLPDLGFAAAIIAHLDGKDAVIPPFEIFSVVP